MTFIQRFSPSPSSKSAFLSSLHSWHIYCSYSSFWNIIRTGQCHGTFPSPEPHSCLACALLSHGSLQNVDCFLMLPNENINLENMSSSILLNYLFILGDLGAEFCHEKKKKCDKGVPLSPIMSRMLSESLQVSLKFLVCFIGSIFFRKIPHCSPGLLRSHLLLGHIFQPSLSVWYSHMLSSSQQNFFLFCFTILFWFCHTLT